MAARHDAGRLWVVANLLGGCLQIEPGQIRTAWIMTGARAGSYRAG
jgi:hypothetical protein